MISALFVSYLFACLLFVAPPANAINSQIHFQGKLANPDGTNVNNGTYSILFTIYDGGDETSGGTNVWSETQSVSVADGVFNVQLGSVNTTLATAVDFTHAPLYLSIKVGADAEMTPRILFTAAPYAFSAAKADNAATLNGISSSGYVQLSPGAQQTGSINISGDIQAAGTYNSNTFTSSSLVFGATSTASVQSGAAQALNLTGNAASTISTTVGTLTLQAGSGTISLGTSTILNANAGLSINSATTNALTLDSGTTGAINIGTNANGKVITIGNTTTGTTITNYVGAGTNVYSIQGASATYLSIDATNNRIYIGNPTPDAVASVLVLDSSSGSDPTGTNGSMYYNSGSGKFRCYENGIWGDCIGTRQVRSFIDTSSDAAADNNTTDYWDIGAENNNSYPNYTPSATNKAITGSVSFETQSATTSDRSIVARIERSIGSVAACGSGTPVGTILSTFTTNNGERAANTMLFVDTPNTTSIVYYTLCADSSTSSAGSMTVNRIRITLEEAINTN